MSPPSSRNPGQSPRLEGLPTSAAERSWRGWRDASGLSLIEVLVATMVFSLFVASAALLGDQIRDYSMRTVAQTEAQQRVRIVLMRIGEDVRRAGADVTGRAFDGDGEIFPETTGSRLRIRTDLSHDLNGDTDTWDVVDRNDDGDTRDNDENENGDGVLDDPREDITYVYDAAAGTLTLVDNTDGTSLLLAENVMPNPDGSPLFRYELDDGLVLAVTAQITIESTTMDAVTGEPATYTGRIAARPRLIRSRVLDAVTRDG